MVAPLALMGLSAAADLVGGVVDAIGKAASPAAAGKDKLKKTAQEFESVFLEQTLDRLTASGGQEGPLGEAGTGGSVYRSMLSKEYAGQIVKSGGLGIADGVYRQMLRLQEGASHAG
ncbi:rod-binding protein [uncultured Enterovirga sp.]|uniref:rod-binding protein n=1 Tax=uncultured Enterovirga sp. TaxID=2026352 RepID=UPI0035CA11A2